MAGTWAQRIAMAWLAYRLTDSVWMLGLLGFASGVPMLVLAPFSGALCDLYDKRRLMLGTQALMLTQSIVLSVLVWRGSIQPWHLLALATLLGVLTAIDTPVRYALVPKLVQSDNIANAIALNSLLMNCARVVGPGLASLLLTFTNELACFALNTASFFVMLFCLWRIRWGEAQAQGDGFRLRFFSEGLRHVAAHPGLRNPMFFAALIALTISTYPTLMPAIAMTYTPSGPKTLGVFMVCAGMGSVCSALLLARQSSFPSAHLPRIAGASGVVAGVAMTGLGFCDTVWLGSALMLAVGGGMVGAIASTNMWLQNAVTDDYRGRVMGLFAMASIGMQPLGSLASGAVGHALDMHQVLALNGAACVLGSVLYSRWRPGPSGRAA